MHIPFYMDNTTAKALLKQSQAYTHAKREEKKREAEARKMLETMGGWSESAMGELIEIYKGLS